VADGLLRRLVLRHYRRFAPVLDLGAEVWGQAITGYEGFDAEHARVATELAQALGPVLGARSTLDHYRNGLAFETRFARFCGKRHAVGLGSCTDALELSLVALGVGPGDEVVTSAHSFIATALAIHHTGARPVLVDPAPTDLCLRAEAVQRALSPRTRAIVPVHMHGHVADMDEILALAQRAGIPVVEDCAQATGARRKGRPVPIGPTGSFSFYPSKPLGGLGNGGMLVTDDDDLAQAVRTLRDPDGADPILLRSGRTPSFLHPVDVALLGIRLEGLAESRGARAERAAIFQQALGHLEPLRPSPDTESAWGAFVIRSDRRDALKQRLLVAGFETKIEYQTPFFESPTFASYGWRPEDYPVARDAARRGLSLPLRPSLPLATVRRMAQVAAGRGAGGA